MFNLDRHIAVSAGWVAGPAFGVAMMAAPEYFHLGPVASGFLFWGGIIVFLATITVVFFVSLHEKGQQRSVAGRVLLMTILALTICGGAAWYFWPREPRVQESSKEEKAIGAALLFEWKWSRLPTAIPASGVVWTMSITSKLEFGGEPLLLSPRPGSPGDKLTWLEDQRQYGGVYRCDITNYSDFPIFNLVMRFKTEFFRPDQDGGLHPKPAAEEYERPVVISKLDPKETFSFYAYSDSKLYAKITLPNVVTYLRGDRDQRETARLLPQPDQSITLFPMTLIVDEAKSPPALSPPIPLPPSRQGKK